MVTTYDGGSNISVFDGSKASLVVDTSNRRIGIGTSTPTVALDIVSPTGIRVIGPTVLTGNTSITGTTNVTGNLTTTGTITASFLSGSAIGLTNVPATRIVGTLPASAYGAGTIPFTALTGGSSGGNFTISGSVIANSISTAVISTGLLFAGTLVGNLNTSNLTGSLPTGIFAFNTVPLSALQREGSFFGDGGGISNISTISLQGQLDSRLFSTASIRPEAISSGGTLRVSSATIPFLSSAIIRTGLLHNQLLSTYQIITSSLTFTRAVGSILILDSIFVSSISSGSLASLAGSAGSFSSLSAGIVNVGGAINTVLLSTNVGFASTMTIDVLNVRTISSGSLASLLGPSGSFSSISTGILTVGNQFTTNNLSTATGFASSFTVNVLNVGFISSGSLAFLNTSTIFVEESLFTNRLSSGIGIFSTLRSGSAFIGQLLASSVATSSLTSVRGLFSSINASTIQAETLSSFIIHTSSATIPNLYVTNIYANTGNSEIINVIASSLNASKGVFLQVIASTFIGSLFGKNFLVVESY
jgi:hypothetical protein